MPSRLRLLGPIAFSPLPFRSTAMLEPCTCRHNRNFILARLKQMRTAERLERVASEAKHWNSICNALELEIWGRLHCLAPSYRQLLLSLHELFSWRAFVLLISRRESRNRQRRLQSTWPRR